MGCSPSRSGATSIVTSSQPPKKRAIDVYLERQGLRRAGCNPNSSNSSSSSSSSSTTSSSTTESADESPGTGTFVSTTVDLVSMYNPVLWMGTESFFPPVARQPQHGTKQRACTFNNVDDKELAKVPSLRRLSSANIHASFKRQGTKVFGQSNNTDTWDVVTDDDGHFQLKYPGPLGGWKREDKNIGYHVREIVLTHRRTLSSVHLTLGRCRTEDGGVRIPTLDDLASDVGAIPNVDKVDVVPGRGCVAYTADRLQEEGGGDDKHIEGARYVGPDGWSFFDISFVAGDEHWLELGDTFSSIHSCLILSYTVPNNAV
eukprot:PhM_4_TR9796/c0_g1_i5/m.18862